MQNWAWIQIATGKILYNYTKIIIQKFPYKRLVATVTKELNIHTHNTFAI